MTMPIDLVLVRHGQSEGNAAIHHSERSDDSAFTDAFLRRHSSEWRLTDQGIEQARVVGAWLKKNMDIQFDRYYVSDYLRAKETAANLELPDARWYIEFILRERERGELDVISVTERKKQFKQTYERKLAQSFYWRPPNGESMADLCMRIDRVLQTLHRECSGKRVIIVSHGEVMWAFRVRLERMTQERWHELEISTDPLDRMNNGQILHYTRRDPRTGTVAEHLNWMRSICPTNPEWSRLEWMPIARPAFSNEQLLSIVNRYPRICQFDY